MAGFSDAVGAMPVPFKVTVWVVGFALSVTVSVAERAPVAPGVNVRTMLHDPPSAVSVKPLTHVVPAGTIAKSLVAFPGAPIAIALLGPKNCEPAGIGQSYCQIAAGGPNILARSEVHRALIEVYDSGHTRSC